jgi:nucleotide-binding universal stress UspA family protein
MKEGHAAKTIVRYAEENDVDHIVMGSTGRSGISRVLLGSVAESVTRRAPCSVVIVREN